MGRPSAKSRIPEEPKGWDVEAGVLPVEHDIPPDPLEPFSEVIARERATLGVTEPVRGDQEEFHAAVNCVVARVGRPLTPVEELRLRL